MKPPDRHDRLAELEREAHGRPTCEVWRQTPAGEDLYTCPHHPDEALSAAEVSERYGAPGVLLIFVTRYDAPTAYLTGRPRDEGHGP